MLTLELGRELVEVRVNRVCEKKEKDKYTRGFF